MLEEDKRLRLQWNKTGSIINYSGIRMFANTNLRTWLRRGALALAGLLLAACLFVGGALTGALKVRHLVQGYFAEAARIVAPEGIDEAGYVTRGGVRQWVTIRGQNRHNPALIFLHGGPGGALADLSYIFQRPWEDYFVVVQWDQRGYGRSNVDRDQVRGSTTKEQYIADATALVENVRQRVGQQKVVLVGQSWEP